MATPRKATAKKATRKPGRQPQDRKPPAQRQAPAAQFTVPDNAQRTAEAWRSGETLHDVQVPSGKWAQARRVALPTFVQRGMIPNSLMPMISKAINSGELDVQEAAKDLDADMLQDIMSLYDVITVECVVQPKVKALPEKLEDRLDPEQRSPDFLYVDEIDFEDKVFLFQWAVGGTSDVEAFRQEQDGAMGVVRPVATVVSPPLNDAGDQ